MPEFNMETPEQEQALSFDAIRIGLASPEKIREWSHGEVKKPETINYRTLKPEKDGLFCERIFGPSKDWECHCGKYKKIRYKGIICDRCGVEVTKASVRRERMGHIELAAPVSHIWYFKGIPSRMGLILDISPRVLEKVLYFASYIVLDPKDTPLTYKQVLTEQEYRKAEEDFGYGSFRAGMGAESIQELLRAIDLDKESEELKAELKNSSGQKRARIIKRLEVVEAFRNSENKPEWMIMDVIPVIQGICNLFLDEFATKHVTYSIEGNVTSVTTIIDITKIEVALYNIMEDAISYIIDNGRVEVKYMLDSHDYRLNVSIIASRSGEGESNVQELNTRFLIAYDYLKVHHSELSIRNIEGNRMREYIFDLLLGDSHYSAREMKTLDKAQSVSLLLPVTVQKDRTVDELNIDSDKTLPVIYLYEGDKDIDLFIKSVFQNKFNISLNTAATDIKHILDKIPSLVIFDVVKEDDYKFELCRKMKEYQILSAIPVIFISSLSSEITEQKAYEAGADVFIAKPFNVASLDARIRQLLDVRTAIKENIRKELIIDPKEVLITSDDDKFVANIINVIEDNIADVEFNIDKLASLLNISRSTLYRRAMEITNLSPSDLIRKRRMRRAAELLKQTSHPVSEICYMVGYSDQRYFGQSFKKEFGMTPKQYSIQKKV